MAERSYLITRRSVRSTPWESIRVALGVNDGLRHELLCDGAIEAVRDVLGHIDGYSARIPGAGARRCRGMNERIVALRQSACMRGFAETLRSLVRSHINFFFSRKTVTLIIGQGVFSAGSAYDWAWVQVVVFMSFCCKNGAEHGVASHAVARLLFFCIDFLVSRGTHMFAVIQQKRTSEKRTSESLGVGADNDSISNGDDIVAGKTSTVGVLANGFGAGGFINANRAQAAILLVENVGTNPTDLPRTLLLCCCL